VSYPAAFAELTAATARLLAADPAHAPAGPLPAAEAPRVLAARRWWARCAPWPAC
jgi:hypothetical protein